VNGENILAVIKRMRLSAIFKVQKHEKIFPSHKPILYGAQSLELEIYEKKTEIFE
jgi:hypothetical protein